MQAFAMRVQFIIIYCTNNTCEKTLKREENMHFQNKPLEL